ncbi:uncharacterized protein CYBJADRAFT_168882 [Cyberlindnera jadinii NRRL Y-1542]|uniref:Uncharacterized protein n=1 Tax=Cyberlindnera jadinii (strain ATCC 18201 / CBS 1600 / BCRC 20928 / JCM 3617 / NBRC 0987 / NRRL Y-1542) TaxID=983966 RepID=A0A1E4RYG5_CYBJN|nr:hypothetical protein CYBJADRAFT_168882 [Cyberlindnera jadinii NRRL Y-1542]ODV72221.1 hypothetical protein CYBJADRAFT_168882 [Cyberlindnera jadinii NRRL Y-1542]
MKDDPSICTICDLSSSGLWCVYDRCGKCWRYMSLSWNIQELFRTNNRPDAM